TPPPPRSTLFPYTTLFRSLHVIEHPKTGDLVRAHELEAAAQRRLGDFAREARGGQYKAGRPFLRLHCFRNPIRSSYRRRFHECATTSDDSTASGFAACSLISRINIARLYGPSAHSFLRTIA